MTLTQDWWRGAVLYQIYPRSYKDSTGNGIGDINGIIEKLDYIASLGVDGIWLSPVMKSPMRDYGYDVSDYNDVDPLFGTLDDFDRLVAGVRDRGLKLITDLVISHTSIDHEWFQESRSSRDNPKADWYVWADAKPDGSPPNNWRSIFGGGAWEYDMRRGQYYFHQFLVSQPDLNLHNPEVRQATMDAARFWLDRGVDGFRLDAINHAIHNKDLTNNPPNPNPMSLQFSSSYPQPYFMQKHHHDKSQPEMIGLVEDIRKTMDEYPDTMTVGEVGDEEQGVKLSAEYSHGTDRLNTCYNFSLLGNTKIDGAYIRDSLEEFLKQPYDGWPSWAFSNHDVVRAASRWLPGDTEYQHDPAFSKLLVALLVTLKGTIFMYQGEELGLPEAKVPYERLQDPWGKFLYPAWQGRDGARTPMPWTDDGINAGFSVNADLDCWLPTPEAHRHLNAASQEKEANSTLNFTRALLKWRKSLPQLATGDIIFEIANEHVLAFRRELEGHPPVRCVFNLGADRIDYPKELARGTHVDIEGLNITKAESLESFGVLFEVLDADSARFAAA